MRGKASRCKADNSFCGRDDTITMSRRLLMPSLTKSATGAQPQSFRGYEISNASGCCDQLYPGMSGGWSRASARSQETPENAIVTRRKAIKIGLSIKRLNFVFQHLKCSPTIRWPNYNTPSYCVSTVGHMSTHVTQKAPLEFNSSGVFFRQPGQFIARHIPQVTRYSSCASTPRIATTLPCPKVE